VNEVAGHLARLVYFVLPACPEEPSQASDDGLILALTAAGHIAVNHVAYALGVRDTRW
jgi:hypothetical protein